MPFEPARTRENPIYALADPVSKPEQQAPDFWSETIPSAFRIDNEVSSFMAQEGRASAFAFDPEFNPLGDLKGYEAFADDLVEAKNADHLAAMKADIDRELEDRRILEASGVKGFGATLAAGILSPINLLPGGTIYRGGKLGFAAFKTAGSATVAGAAATATSELALHATQRDRTVEESLVAIGAGALLAGSIGGAVSAYGSRKALDDLAQRVSDDFVNEAPDLRVTFEEAARDPGFDLSAARAAQTTLEDETLVKSFGLEKATKALNPVLRLTQSPSRAVRKVAEGLIENPLYLNKNTTGIASERAVETLAKEGKALLARAIEGSHAGYKAHRAAKGTLGRREFAEEVGRAMRRGDASPVPGVTEAARAMRTELFDPLKDRAVKAGLLPEDVEPGTAISYLSRLYSRERIIAREDEFRGVIREWAVEKAQQAIRAERAPMARAVNNIKAEIDEIRFAQERDAVAADRPDEADLEDGVTADDVKSAIALMQQGAPKAPQTLTQFLAGKGGVKDFKGELKILGITNKTRPGFVRNQTGLSLDDAAYLAWEEGFIRTPERPTISEFLEALGEDFNQTKLIVRLEDEDIARELEQFEDIRRSLEELGVDLGDVKSPLSRRAGQSDDMKAVVARANELKRTRQEQKIKDLEARLSEAESDLRIAEETRLDLDEYAEEITDSLVAKLKGYDQETQPFNIAVAERGPLAERVFDIADEKIEDFLESDAELIAHRYQRIVSADVELQEKFGSTTLRAQIDEINESYADLAKKAKTEKERVALEKARKSDVRDIEAMRDLIRGTYRHSDWDNPSSTFTRVNRTARDFRYMALMGGVTVSSFPDVARPVMVHGLYRTFRSGWAPFVTNLRGRAMSRAEAKLAGQVTETILQSRVAALAELADPYAQGTAFERFISNTSRVFGNLTLLNYWNNTMKEIASAVTMTRVLDISKGLKKADAKDRAYLNFIGIDESMAERIAKQFRKHGETIGAVKVAHTEAWDDDVAVRAFRAALNKDVDSTVVTPGVGDKPLWMNTELGKSVGQFKSFMFAANQRVMLRAGQRQDRGALSGMMMMIGLGAMVYWAKTMLHDPSKLSDDPRVWLAEGIDRSGIIPVMMEANNISEKVGFPLTFRALTGGGVASRYASRSLPETLLGPSLGQVTDVALTLRAIFNGEASDQDIAAFRRLLPFQNLFYLRPLLDLAQDEVTDADG
jgi:hypothetical protein